MSSLLKYNSSIITKIWKNLQFRRCQKASTSVISNESTIENRLDNKRRQLQELSSEEINKRLMSFFDHKDNWSKEDVQSGRSWRMEELRIKSNSDLHKLWYILYKERNMLLTMEQAAKDRVENMASPERIVKVEDSMKNIEEVIKERNRAYWKLEVGNTDYVERRKAFRKDIFGRWRWISCSEHLVPYWMNSNWRKLNAPGFGADVIDFNRRFREKRHDMKLSAIMKQRLHCQQLLLRFPDMDLEFLQEKFPDIDVKDMKENLDEYVKKYRQYNFHSIFYEKRNDV